MLVLLTGLPGTGKSEIARRIAPELGALILSADPIDATLLRVGIDHDRPDIVGFELMKTVAREHLALDMPVVIDAVNPFQWVRDHYGAIAAAEGKPFALIATTCNDSEVHRSRVERRYKRGEKHITWDGVERQIAYYEPPTNPAITLDASGSLEDNVAMVLERLTQLR